MTQLAQNDHYASDAELALDYAAAVNDEIRDLFAAGADVVQVDEPYMQAHPEPARDYGVAALQRAFALVWDVAGESLDPCFLCDAEKITKAGDVTLRVVAGMPNGPGTYRLDLTIASVARSYLLLTDAYFVGTSAYVGALAAAARDGVDVRLLVPGPPTSR
jgi:hypothetical protein